MAVWIMESVISGRNIASHCLSVCPLGGPGSIPHHSHHSHRGGVLQEILFLAYHTLSIRPEPARQKMSQSPLNGTTRPVDIEEEALRQSTAYNCCKTMAVGY